MKVVSEPSLVVTCRAGFFNLYMVVIVSKQLLDEVSVISRTIKVEVGVISRSRRIFLHKLRQGSHILGSYPER